MLLTISLEVQLEKFISILLKVWKPVDVDSHLLYKNL